MINQYTDYTDNQYDEMKSLLEKSKRLFEQVEMDTTDLELTREKEKTEEYEVSSGRIVVHGYTTNDITLTDEEKNAYQETMDDFIDQVSDLVDYGPSKHSQLNGQKYWLTESQLKQWKTKTNNMEFLRKSWKWVLGTIGFFIGLVWMMNTNSSRKVKNIKKNIRSNENKTSEVDGNLKDIKNKKPKIKKKTVKQATNAIKNRLKKK